MDNVCVEPEGEVNGEEGEALRLAAFDGMRREVRLTERERKWCDSA